MSAVSPSKMERRQTAELCSSCGKHPRLGALSRCASCLKAAADVDRQSRADAEARVAARADRQAALEKLGDLYLKFAASPEGTRFLEMQQADLVAPRNDPEYLQALRQRDKDREAVANEITHVHHAIVWGRSRLGLTLKDDRNLAKAREVAQKLQGLFESELIFSEDPHDPTKLADRTQKQTPRHEFGREKRSLGREPKKGAPVKTGSAPRGRK